MLKHRILVSVAECRGFVSTLGMHLFHSVALAPPNTCAVAALRRPRAPELPQAPAPASSGSHALAGAGAGPCTGAFLSYACAARYGVFVKFAAPVASRSESPPPHCGTAAVPRVHRRACGSPAQCRPREQICSVQAREHRRRLRHGAPPTPCSPLQTAPSVARAGSRRAEHPPPNTNTSQQGRCKWKRSWHA
jgi:hypothetical protein